MKEPLRDKVRLEHILQAIEKIEEYTQEMTEQQLSEDSLRLHASAYNIQIIGEAVCKLSDEFKGSHPDTPWRVIEKMRHILVHDYFAIDIGVLWSVIEDDLPLLKNQIQKYLNEV